MSATIVQTTEGQRLAADSAECWREWGPYLSERQWGTVREDYSADGDAWRYFPHEHARSRAYRWGEDGLAGFSDKAQRWCLGLALWNEHDAIIKERCRLNNAEATTVRTSRNCTFSSTVCRVMPTCVCSTNIPTRRFPTPT